MEVSVVLSLSFGLASGAAGSVSIPSAAGTGQNQLTAELSGAELILIPGTVAVAAIWTITFVLVCINVPNHNLSVLFSMLREAFALT